MEFALATFGKDRMASWCAAAVYTTTCEKGGRGKSREGGEVGLGQGEEEKKGEGERGRELARWGARII